MMLNRTQTLLIWIFLGVALVGFLDSLYLFAAYYTGAPLVCSILEGCNVVAASPYAKIAGIPLAFLGLLYYAIQFTIAGLFLLFKRRELIEGIFWFALLGVFASVYFVYLQYFVIEAVCMYCMISAIASLVLFAVSWGLRREVRSIRAQ